MNFSNSENREQLIIALVALHLVVNFGYGSYSSWHSMMTAVIGNWL